MQATSRLVIVAFAILANVPSVAALPLEFGVPAQAGPTLGASGASWMLVVVSSGGNASFELQDSSELIRREHEQFVVGDHKAPQTQNKGWTENLERPERTPLPPRVQMKAQTSGFASFYVEGEDVRTVVKGAAASIQIPPGSCLQSMVLDIDADRATRSRQLCPGTWPAVVARPQSGEALKFHFEGRAIQRAEWHNMQVECLASGACPPGGAQENHTVWLSPTDYVRTHRNVFEDARGPPSAKVTGWGDALLIIFGGTSYDLNVDGWVRLPMASSDAGCPTCLAPSNQTFFAFGNITLASLQQGPRGGLQSEFEGDLVSARFDETDVDPQNIINTGSAVAAAVTGIGLVAFVKWFLLPLFTRHSENDLLRNERRRRLFEYVIQNPGTHFREALRGAQVPAGSGRHHVNRLVRAGLLAERRLGSKVCLFENKLALHASWQEHAAVRDPNLRLLHDWLANHPDQTQQEIIVAFRHSQEWPRSATQGRLERLVRDGMVRTRMHGRYKHYATAKISA